MNRFEENKSKTWHFSKCYSKVPNKRPSHPPPPLRRVLTTLYPSIMGMHFMDKIAHISCHQNGPKLLIAIYILRQKWARKEEYLRSSENFSIAVFFFTFHYPPPGSLYVTPPCSKLRMQ